MTKALLSILSAMVLFYSCSKEKNLPEQKHLNTVSTASSDPVNAVVNQHDTTGNSLPLKKKVAKIKYPRPK